MEERSRKFRLSGNENYRRSVRESLFALSSFRLADPFPTVSTSRTSGAETTATNWVPTSSIAAQRMETNVEKKEKGRLLDFESKEQRGRGSVFERSFLFCITLQHIPGIALYTCERKRDFNIEYNCETIRNCNSSRAVEATFFFSETTSTQHYTQDGQNSTSWTQWNEEEGRSRCIQERKLLVSTLSSQASSLNFYQLLTCTS